MKFNRHTGQQYKQFQKIRRAKRLPKRIAEIETIGRQLNLIISRLESNHLRITNHDITVDIHPLHRIYRNLSTGERGNYSSAWELLLDCFRRS